MRRPVVPLRVGGNPATDPAAAYRLHLGGVAGSVYTNGVCQRLARPFESLNLGESGMAFVLGLIEKMAPRDPLEEMLVVQALMAHLRAMHLSDLSWRQTGTENLKVVNEHADRASNTFRRLVLALGEYRRPPRAGDSFTAIRQANIAGQQIVMNAESPARNPANEQGCGDGETGTGGAGIGDRARRPYRLSPEGLASLRATARRVRPWERSTGPKTAEGRARSRMNAWRHGARSAAMREEMALLAEVLREWRAIEREGSGTEIET